MLRRSRPVEDDYEPPVEEDGDYDEPVGRRRVGGWKTTSVLLLFTLVFLGIGVLRVIGVDGNQVMIAALALTPYVAPGGLLLALIAWGLRRRLIAAAVLLIAFCMVILLLPRFLADDQPAADGPRVRVMSAELDPSQADAASIMRAVRDNQVDVLTLPQLQSGELAELDDAGLAAELPHRVLDPRTGTSGIVSRFPLRQTILIDASEPSAVVDLPGRDDLEILTVHIESAADAGSDAWRRELARLPPTAPNRMRVLAGNFNATIDHAAFRALLDLGYVDAADQTGKGLIPTWSSWRLGPPIAIDHVLVDHRCAIHRFAVVNLPGGDHDAVLADLTLP